MQAKLNGQASASVNNFGAQVDIARIKATDWAKSIAGPLGSALTATGPLVAGLGIVLDIYRARKVAAATAEGAATVALMANSAAMGGAAAATTVETVAQTGLNVAMDANPIGLVAAAIGGLLALVGGAALLSGMQNNTQAMNDYTTAIQADTGAIGENTRAAVTKKLNDDGTLQTATKLGISSRLLVDATLGLAGANEELTKQIKSKQAAMDASIKAHDQTMGRLDPKLQAVDNNFKKLTDSIALNTKSVKDSKDSVDRYSAAMDDTSASLDVAERRARALGSAIAGIPTDTNINVNTVYSSRKGADRAFASGGIVTSPTRGIVGESGPEAVIPLNGGRLPMFGGGGSTTVNVNVSGTVVGSTTDLAKLVLTALTNAKRVGAISGAEFGRLAI